MYHSISEGVSDDPFGIYTVSKECFESQIKLLYKNKDKIQFKKLTDVIEDEKNSLVITFDDGFKDNLLTAAPILNRYNIPFTVFVATGLLNKEEYLTCDELKVLAELDNCEIGAHGHSHVKLSDCSEEKVTEELSLSKKILEDLLGRPVDVMSYPHGDYNEFVLNKAREVGFKVIGSSHYGVNRTVTDKLRLNRFVVTSSDSAVQVLRKVMGHYDWMEKVN